MSTPSRPQSLDFFLPTLQRIQRMEDGPEKRGIVQVTRDIIREKVAGGLLSVDAGQLLLELLEKRPPSHDPKGPEP